MVQRIISHSRLLIVCERVGQRRMSREISRYSECALINLARPRAVCTLESSTLSDVRNLRLLRCNSRFGHTSSTTDQYRVGNLSRYVDSMSMSKMDGFARLLGMNYTLLIGFIGVILTTPSKQPAVIANLPSLAGMVSACILLS